MDLTPQQDAAIAIRAPRICVAAGAGSGKTFVLVQRIVSLLREDVDLDGIVAITFTDKAAAEMKARLRKAFRELADPADPGQMSRWRGFERRLDTARISTIHSFCMRLLKENALQLGLDPDFGLLSEPQSRLLVRDAARETLIALVNEGQPEVLRLVSEWTLPRLGKLLASLASKTPALLGVLGTWPLHDPAELAAFWRRAAEAVLLEESRTHSVCRQMRLLRERLAAFEGECSAPEKDGREIRRRALLEQIDAMLVGPANVEGLRQIGERVATLKTPNGFARNWPSEERLDALKEIQEDAKKLFARCCSLPDTDMDLENACAALTQSLAHVLRAFSERLSAAKSRRNALDFDDLVARTATALSSNVPLRDRAAAGITHLLMDEFQDTDQAQLAIADALCKAPTSPRLFVVGDAKQSIYRFRGADVSVFNDVRGNADDVLPLARNFRSAPGILEFVNDFFRRSDLLGEVEVAFGALEANRPEAESAAIEFLIGEGESEGRTKAKASRELEADLIAKRIRSLCLGDPIVWDEPARAYRQPRPGDFVILLRAMSNVHLYEEALSREGVEFGVVAGAGFYERQEVIDVLNLLKLMLDPYDEPALLAVLRSPICALRDDTLALLCEQAPLPRALLDGVVPQGILDPEALTDARALLAELRAQRELPLDAFVQFVLERTHYEAILLSLPGGIQRASNLRKLADLAAEFTAAGDPSLRTFAAWLDDMRSAAVREGDALLQPQEGGAVTLMTVHKSKGLEFPIVILADASAEIRGRNDDIPTHRALGTVLVAPGEADERRKALWREMIGRRNQREEFEEHARLLYVALTRARDYLIVSGAARAGTDSWLDLLDSVYQVSQRSDGALLSGPGWRGLVRRNVGELPKRGEPERRESVDWQALFDRVSAPLSFAVEATSISVSELLNRMEAGLGDEEERIPREDEAPRPASDFALLRGALVHRMFELWRFGAEPAPVDLTLAGEPLSPVLSGSLRSGLERVAANFEALPLHGTLASARQLLREHPFVLRVGDWLVRGTLDALLESHTIIDYKTGSLHPERHERYLWQLRLYAAAALALTGVLPERGVLVYVDEPAVHEFPITPADADAALSLASRVLAG